MRRLLVLMGITAALAGCGSDDEAASPPTVTVGLDFTPNAAHAGIYAAVRTGRDEENGVRISIRPPAGGSPDSLKLLATRRADIAVLDIHDLGLARERGADLVGVMALVQRPLASVLAQPSIRRPRDLEGRRAGVTGLPSDVAVLRSVVAGDGGDPGRVEEVTIGFKAVQALLARRVDAATAFWNAEGVALRRRRPEVREFRVDDFGAPAYPELVLAVTRTTLDERRPLVEAAVRALQRGYTEVQADPEAGVQTLAGAVDGLDPASLAAELDAVLPAFTAGARFPGELRADVLEDWARWDAETQILERVPDVGAAFDTTVARPVSRN
jgi:putative hydroxymethylpyrimidine transport system substrate-binding protein